MLASVKHLPLVFAQVGAGKALALSHQYSLPLVRVHHMEAHALVARMGLDQQQPPSQQQPSQQQSQTQQQQGQQGSGQHQEEDQQPQRRVPFPFLCMLVSGGHNLLVLVRGVGDYVQLGTTLDDALGGSLGWWPSPSWHRRRRLLLRVLGRAASCSDRLCT